METPKIVAKLGRTKLLQPGTYYYCRCGLSADGLFCDGSHKGTSFEPKKFEIDEPKSVYMCMCKHTQNAPYCDATHKKLKKEDDE